MHKRRTLEGALMLFGLMLLLAGCATPDPPSPPPANATNVIMELTPIEYAPARKLP